jgi:hypothetical protein
MALREPEITEGGAVPAVGFFRKGHIHINSAPSASTPALWLCTASGEPGTWLALGAGAAVTSSGTGGIGYTTGAGGTITQAASKSGGVTLNKVCGNITMNGAALAAAAEVSFTLTNSTIEATDVIVVNHVSAGTAGAYLVGVSAVGAGSCSITVSNASAGSLSEAIVLRFAVIKAVTA